jgi:hypothetical protein
MLTQTGVDFRILWPKCHMKYLHETPGIHAPSPLPRLDARERISNRLLKFQKRMLDVEACVGFARDALEVSTPQNGRLLELMFRPRRDRCGRRGGGPDKLAPLRAQHGVGMPDFASTGSPCPVTHDRGHV